MSDEIGTYGFLPWLRQGMANNIASPDMDAAVKLRASVHLELALTGKAVDGGADLVEPIPRDVALYGPGDIIGIDSKAIIKNEPRNWITNFETNYMPYVDFYDEDFPWRYTPAAPDTAKHRLRPWICLIVLKEDEFKDGQNMKDRPLPYLEATNAATSFPAADQLWAWAHVHTNRDIVKKTDHVVNTDKNAVIASLQALLNENPDLAYSRILCPRKLEANTAYHAFLVPVFETGRLAGLGHKPEEAPADVHATFSAWGDYAGRPEPQYFPYYHRWYFRTGNVGDFEYLVRLLKPQPMDSRVGRRDMDVQKPAVQIRGITDADLGGILKLGGALKIPFDTLGDADKAEVLKYDGWAEPYPHDFQRDLAAFINLADNYQNQSALDANQNAPLSMDFINDPDPLITAPLYGRWHSMTQRLEMSDTPTATSRNWVHELNLDPRWRVAAGYGTGVVQKKQEEYMDAAWHQVGDVLAANRKIRFAQFAWLASMVWYSTHLTPIASISNAKAITLTRPLHSRVLMQGKTLLHTVKNSLVPPAALSSPMRRVMRSSSQIIKALPFTDELKPDALVTRLNDEEITPAPPKTTPDDLPTLDDLAEDTKPQASPPVKWIARHPWVIWLIIILLFVLLLILPFSWILIGQAATAILGLATLAVRAQRWLRETKAIEGIKEENQTPESIDDLPHSPDFQILPLDLANPALAFTPSQGATDSTEGIHFKAALKDTYDFVQLSGNAAVRPIRNRLNLAQVAETTLAGINPSLTLSRLVLNQILIPERIAEQLPETFTEAMAYPVIDLPMYQPLVDISSELFLPNINFVPQNSISLLETNQKFIESYMVGLNHEFARELLWREYPTDQRGSYFRQFWDVSSYLNKDGLDEETLREKLRDIPPLHRWSRYSELGDHDHREEEGEEEEELVLVIRGELLKKYPTAVIYAHRAKWQLKENGEIDNTKERVLVEDEPIENHIKTPLYEAKVHPDINFFGFDLTALKAKGGTGENPGDDPGWFFVIKECPGEPRFGLDIDRDGDINLWNDLSWDDALPGGAAGEHLQITNATPTITLTNPAGDPSLQEKLEQYEEDKHITWSKDTNAAQLAYILYQVPVLVAVHASEMLPKQYEKNMPFNDAQQQMNQAQTARRERELELFAAKEKLAKLGRAKDQAARFSEQDAAALAKQEKALQKQIQKIKTALADAQAAELDARGIFADFSDPRKHLAQLNDNTPILLFPLRIETRFKTLTRRGTPATAAAPATRHELWVRVYPDDIAIDGFEPLLSESEVKNAATYFAAIEAAGDDEGKKRAAWRSLAASHGGGRAHWIVQTYQPEGAAEPDTKLQGWTQAPKTHVLPERLVLMAFNKGTQAPVLEAISEPIPASLAVGPDPSLDESEQIRIEDGNIVVNTEMKWMVDFEEALTKGMGFKIPLTAQQAQNGFDTLYVLGVKLGTNSTEGKHALETLLDHHHHSRKGFGLLRQGTPTNNTDTEGSGYSWQEDTDESFDRYFPATAPSDPTDWETKKDGRTLAEMLGIDAAILQPTRHYYHTDMAEAKAMNHALWPATLGYFMENMMEPVFSDATIRQTRDFFCRYVTGRGAIPAIRVGKQPYGILPATPFRRMQWLRGADKGFLLKLYSILQTMSDDWDELLDHVAHVGKDGDPHQLLLDIVGLHPSSVEFYSRNAQSFEQLLNTFALKGLGGAFIAALIAAGYVKSGMDLLEKFGYTPEQENEGIPDMLKKFFFDRGDLLKGPVVDDVPLSETAAIRDYTDDGRNYIEWLIDAANTSHNALRAKQGFTDNQTPAALLFLMLHHALDLGYVDTSLRLKLSKNIITPAEMVKARQEPKFIHVQEQNDAGSRWKDLYKADARITGDATLQLGDFIATVIPDADDARQLCDQLDALDYLKDVPTARLERIFAEHLDLCTYRLDAWIQGLVHYQLDLMRHQQQEVRQGIYLGAYGLLENVRPENKVLTPVELPDDLAIHFADPIHPLTSDSTNGGYIHAPSSNHAVTAAVLRNGYIENANAENPGSFAVNLTSNRVRLALEIIEGMQAGQSLAALLGYQLERGLHDNHAAEVDGIIYDLRLAFPLRSNRMKDTQVEDLDSIDTVEARNVVDALSLIEHIQKTGNKNYPFDHPKLPTNLSTTQKQVIDAEVERILNINDAVADLAIAESVHQVVQGNYDRAAATLDTYSKGNFPPTPDVIKTPRSGFTLTHRAGLQLETGLNPAAASNITPRSKAEPAVNKWLASILPAMDKLACKVEFTTPAGITQSEVITLDMLGFLPIDALYMVSLHSTQAMASLDDAFTLYVLENFSVAPDSDIKLLYTEPLTGKISLHEVAPLLHSQRALLQRSRPLNASDISLMHEGTVEATKQNTALDKTRITLCRNELNTLKTQFSDYADALLVLVTPEDANLIMPELDDLMQDLAKLLQKLAFFGLPQAGSGFIFGWQQTHFRTLSQRLETFLQRQQGRLDSFEATMAEYAALPGTATNAEHYTLLQTAERFISTNRGDTGVLSPNAFQNDLLNVRKPAFEQWLNDTLDVLASASLSDMYAALLPVVAAVPDFDTEALALTDELSQLLLFTKDLLAKSQAIRDDLQTRVDAVDALITKHDTATTAPEKVNALLNAGKLLLGEEFKIIPEFTLSPTQAAEWQSAYNDQPQLLSHQLNALAEDFPMDNWLYGIARVREKMGHVEQAAIMAEALADKTLALEPVQLPYRANDNWLALEFPATTKITEDKLLYTAHYATPFDSTRPQCGLLLDEWTEIIPGTEETTGLTFHYDRPNTEPPQTLLLATPADFTGKWRWQDLVDTLHDTLDLAKKRAIEPEQIDRTSYARFLPALVSAFTVYPITASLNLALNNQFYLLKETEDE